MDEIKRKYIEQSDAYQRLHRRQTHRVYQKPTTPIKKENVKLPDLDIKEIPIKNK